MGELTTLVWNCGGLNAPHKRTSTLGLLKKRNVDVAFLSETHLLKADNNRLANRFYYTLAASSASTKTKGVAIVVKRNLPLKVLSTWSDTLGRIVISNVELGNRKIALISAYAPNNYDKLFYNTLTCQMLELTGFSFIVGADFNAVWDPSVDRSGANATGDQAQATNALRFWANNLGLIDVWRVVNPTHKDFSFYSGRHKSFSRIDFLFASSHLFSSIGKSVLLPIALSDHKGVLSSTTLGKLSQRAVRWRFNSSLLRDETYISQFIAELEIFTGFNVGSVDDPRILWDAIKGFIRSNAILYCSNKRKIESLHLTDLETEFSRLDSLLQTNFSDSLELKRSLVKKEINDILKQKSEFLIHRSRQRYYFQGARPSHLLAMRIRANDHFADIPMIKSEGGVIRTDPDEVNSTFQNFYSNLYKSETILDKAHCILWLEELNLPRLKVEDSAALDKPITLDDLKEAVQSMQKGKSPGLDGIPPEFYITFWDQLGPFLLDMIQSSIERGELSRDVNTALISLLLKKDKDPCDCSSYRPLSLLNSDLKIFAKLLAQRLEAFMPSLINHDQTGFIKTRMASDNVRRLLHIVEAAESYDTPMSLLSLDAMKAFDRLEWPFLWSVLEVMGFGQSFIGMIRVLYSNPSARVLTGRTFSSLFPVSRSSRQGCPLSPSLFVLSLEPLAQAIRQSQSISPISLHNTRHHLSLFADDIMVFLENPPQSIPNLLSICENYGKMSGFKINWSKSALLHLNEAALNTNTSFGIPTVRQFKYLGIEIFPSLNKIVKNNYLEAQNNVFKDMEKWVLLPMSIQARVSIVKMNILPRINFVSSMLPLSPPTDYWTKLHSAVSKFIWKGKRPRLKMSTLQRKKDNGGLAVPDFKLYFWSFVLRPLLTWFNPDITTSWLALECAKTEPWSLHDALFSNISNKQCQLRFGSIISYLFKIWRVAEKFSSIDCKWHSYSPVFNNKSLLIGGSPAKAPQWEQQGVHYLRDICNDSGLLPFPDLQKSFNLPRSSFFFYLQLRSALKAQGVPWQSPLPIHPMRKLLTSQSSTKGMVSRLYNFLAIPKHISLPIERVWLRDCTDFSEEFDWDDVWTSIPEVSRNPDHQYIHYNFIHRTYLTPVKMHHMKIITSPLCTLCPTQSHGTFLHMFWDCGPVSQFWSQVASCLSRLFNVIVPVHMSVLILNDLSPLGVTGVTQRAVYAGLTAAKKMVATRWKPPHELSMRHWSLMFLDVIYMELSTARVNGASEKTLVFWRSVAASVKDLMGH